MAGDGDLFGDSSSDADTDDLIAAAKSKPIAKKKDPKKKAAPKEKIPDADNDDDDDDDDGDDSDFEGGGGGGDAGLFDSSDEDEGPKKQGSSKAKKLGGKKRKKPAAKKKKKPSAAAAEKNEDGGGGGGPPKKDTRSMKERMEALAKKRSATTGAADSGGPEKKKRAKSKGDGEGGKEGGGEPGKEGGYASGDAYDSETFERTKDDDDFIDADDEDPDALKELYSEQHFEDERPDEYDSEEEKKMKKKAYGGGGKSAGLDKISLSDDEDDGTNATSALKMAVKRMKPKKKIAKKLNELEEEGTEFLKLMEAAADADEESIAKRKPGMKKLAMLQSVMDMLARKDMTRVLLDLDLLVICKRWIQPLPNGSLCNVTLRRRILEAVTNNMSGENGVNTHDLKQSGFGKTVMQLFNHRSETPEMKKMLKNAIEQWSRPIFQKSGNMRDLERAQAARGSNGDGSLVGIARAHAAEERREERRKTGPRKRGRNTDDLTNIITGDNKAKGSQEAGSNRVRIPYSKGFQYSIRPESRHGNVGDKRNLVSAKAAGGGSMTRDGDKREALGKRMIEKSRKTNKQTQRSANISIEGRVVK
jgi:transcription factor SPN1